ncbi:MAG: peptidoglycan DD-metalloendopeptidase family protein [Alphaproteobacteria bacterium]
MRLRRFELIAGIVCFVGGLSLIVYDFFQNSPSEEPKKITLQIGAESSSSSSFKIDQDLLLAPFKPKTMVKEIIIKKDGSFSGLLQRHGLSSSNTKKIQQALKPYYKEATLKRGQRFYIQMEKENNKPFQIKKVIFLLPPGKKISLVSKGEGLVLEKKPDILPKKFQYLRGKIQDSLYIDGLKAGLSKGAIKVLTQQFSYSLDMQRALRRNDTFEVLVERAYDKETGFIDPGSILYASLTTKMGPQKLYRFALKDTQIEYFNEQGEGVRKALLKTPVRGARLSSPFAMRKHPILGYTKMHQGVDFAAPMGTPILAAGNGSIKKRGYLGSYGNYILIQHNKNYASAYAHLSKFAKGLSTGSRVSQGQIIGYIGRTGRATGPHLHYEVHYKGKPVNPHKIQMPSQRNLRGSQYHDFLTHTRFIQAQVKALKFK